VKNHKGKNYSAKREKSLNHRDYNELSMLYYKFNFLELDPVQKRKRSSFIAES